MNKLLTSLETYIEEYKSKKIFKKNNPIYSTILEKTFNDVVQVDAGFGGWALSKPALRSFCGNIFKNCSSKEIHLTEFGGGQSTLFWLYLMKNIQEKIQLNVTTFEHDSQWIKEINEKIQREHSQNLENIDIIQCELKKISDDEWNDVFSHCELKKWQEMGGVVTEEEHKNTRIHNTFYNLQHKDIENLNNIDGMILDGPHGNGRGLAFPLLSKCLKDDAIILIDDFNHYSFLENLNCIFKFKILEKHEKNNDNWVVVKLKGKK